MKTYKEHYRRCKKEYKGPLDDDQNIYEIGLIENPLTIDRQLLLEVSRGVNNHFDNHHDIVENNWGKYVNDLESIPQLNEFCTSLIRQVERKYFHSSMKIEFLHILENKHNAPEESSWVWHYDDCPKEFFKLAIYLNDVSEESGAMQYLKSPNDLGPVIIETFRDNPNAIKGVPPLVFPKSRVPDSFIKEKISEGHLIKSLSGPQGTHFLFTPNIPHRGTVPKNKVPPRRAIFMFIRPSMKKIVDFIKPAHPKKVGINVKKYALD